MHEKSYVNSQDHKAVKLQRADRDYKFQYVQYNTELHNCIMHCITYFGNYRPTQSLPKCKYHLETC